MKIFASNYQTQNYTNFKSTFPVVHWVRETNGSFAPISSKEILEPLQDKLVTMLNDSILTQKDAKKFLKISDNKENAEKNISKRLKTIMDVSAQKLRAYLSLCDVDYRLAKSINLKTKKKSAKVRSFYNNLNGGVNNPYTVSYLITGRHVDEFDNKFGKAIGIQQRVENSIKADKLKELHKKYLEEVSLSPEKADEINQRYNQEIDNIRSLQTEGNKNARRKYNYDGLKYVNDYLKRIKDQNGATQVLHTKFEIVRNEEGEAIGYKFLDARFLPEFGPNSPFERLKRWIV